jgi:hypothetical protein
MKKRCATCRHWAGNDNEPHGTCRAIHAVNWNPSKTPDAYAVIHVEMEAEDLAWFDTMGHFACASWAREPNPEA